MASTIIDDSGLSVVFANSQFARTTSIGSNWTTLRIGFRLRFNAAADIGGTPRLYIGMLAGTSNLVGDASTSHYLGIRTLFGTWNYSTFGVGSNSGTAGASWEGFRRVGTTTTSYVMATGGAAFNQFRFNSNVDTKDCVIVEITKGSPYTIGFFRRTATNGAQTVTTSQFLAAIEGQTLALTNFTLATVTAADINEGTDGALDSVCIGWDRTSVNMFIDDLTVVRVN